jgi:hypothetical protein
MTINAHFDGRVIVPDEPLDLLPNQAVILHIETASSPAASPESSALNWLASHATESDVLPQDLADRHDHYLYNSAQDRRR